MSTCFAKIANYTKSIVVNGKNAIEVGITYENKGSGNYFSEMYIQFGSNHFYKALISDTNSPFYTNKVTYTIPVDWLANIPDSSIGTGKIKVETIDMDIGKSAHLEEKPFTLYVPEEYKPEISNISVVMHDVNYGAVDYAVYGLTKPYIYANVSPHSTSPIKKWYIRGGGIDDSGDCYYATSSEGKNFMAMGSLIKTWSNTTFTLTVEDGRGRTASITSDEFYVQPYTRPLVKSLSAYRTDENGITQADGGYIKVTLDGGMSTIKDSKGNEVNTLKCYLDWKDVNGSYSHFTEITNKEPFLIEADKDLNFEIKCEVRDKYLKTIAYCNVVGDAKELNIVDGGGGAAIGTKATKGYFDVAHNSRFQKGISANNTISSKEGLVSTGTGSKGDFLSFGEATSIAAYVTPGGYAYGDDFNDYTDIGVYGVYEQNYIAPDPAKGGLIYNIPIRKPGTLRVYNSTGDVSSYAKEKHLIQEYVVYDGSEVYRRHLSKIRDNSEVEWPVDWTFGEWNCFTPSQSGTSGIWTYEKKANGIAECWGKWEGVLTHYNSGNGFYHYTADVMFPYGLFISSPIPTYTATVGVHFTVSGLTLHLSKDGMSCYAMSTSGGENTVTFYIRAKGNWK